MPPLADNDAILDEDVDVDTADRPKSAREIAMENIDLANLKRLEEESGVKLTSDDDEDEDHDDQIDQQLGAVADPAAAPAAPQVSKVLETVDGAMVRTKIDGEEREVPVSELVRSYQKNASADKRLEEATRLLRQAEETSAQVAAQTTATQNQSPEPAVPSKEVQVQVKEALEKLYEGDADSATAMFAALLANNRGGDQPTPAPQQIDINQVAAQVVEQTATSGALTKIQTDYPDIYADPAIEQLAAIKAQTKINGGTPRAEALLQAADEVYTMLGKTPAGRQPEPKPAPTNDKLIRKQQMDQLPVASSTAASPLDEDDAAPSSVIKAMAAKRLGQSLPTG